MDKERKKRKTSAEAENSHIGWEHPEGFLPEEEDGEPTSKQESR